MTRARSTLLLSLALPAAALAAQSCFFPEYTTTEGAVTSTTQTSSTTAQGGSGGSGGVGAASGGGGVGGSGAAGGGGSGGSGGSGGAGCPSIGAAEAIACNQGNTNAIAIDATNVYWTDEANGTVMMAPKSGGSPVPLATGENQPCGITVRGLDVLWRTRAGGEVRRKSPMVTDPLTFAGGQTTWAQHTCAITTDATRVYWFYTPSDLDAEVMMGFLDGSGIVSIASAMQPTYIDAANGTNVYWADLKDGKVFYSPKVAGDSKMILESGVAAVGIVTDATHYFVGQLPSAVRKGALEIGSPPLLATSVGELEFTQIAAFNQHIYWATSDGTIQRANKGLPEDQVPEPVVSVPGICAIAVDETHAYFTTCAGGAVMRAPLP